MVKGLFSLAGVVIIATLAVVNAVCRMSFKVGWALQDEVTRKLGRTVTLFSLVFSWPRSNRRARGEIEQHAKIETLPDEILLEIFDCVRLAVRAATKSLCDPDLVVCCCGSFLPWNSREWHRLVHVCRRWRSLVFASPHRLDLRLVYTFNCKARVMKKALDSWSTLPIAVWYPWECTTVRGRSLILEDENSASIALQHPNRIREINLCLTNSLLLKTRAQVLASFPTLEYLWLESWNPRESQPTLPVGFLGGSAPRLRYLYLDGFVFPSFPLLLSSARDLVSLRLDSVSKCGYFSPEKLSSSLSMLTQLQSLIIHFLPFVLRKAGNAGRPLAVRAILPALTRFQFSGNRAYLENLISRIDSPILEQPRERLFKRRLPSEFETQQLSQFTSHPSPHVLADQSSLLLGDKIFLINRFRTSSIPINRVALYLTYEEIHSEATLPHIFSRHWSKLCPVEWVDPISFLPRSHWLDPDEVDSALWVDFFRKLWHVTVLEVAGMVVQIVESVLEQLPEDMVPRVLPALNDLYVLGRCEIPGPFENFASARRASGHPITVHYANQRRKLM